MIQGTAFERNLLFTEKRFCFLTGIYEIFCKEIFGVKAKNLEFGLQPYKIPETGTVR